MATNEYSKYLVLKSAIEELFGNDAWYALKESNHFPTWRKYAIKTLQAVRVAISTSVDVCDDKWREEINQLLADGITEIKKEQNIDEIIATLAGTLVRISFTQIGLMPNRKGTPKSVTLHKDVWRLNSFRSVIYTQTREQKERLFWREQQSEIGFNAQLDIHTEYRQSQSSAPYSEWCKNTKST